MNKPQCVAAHMPAQGTQLSEQQGISRQFIYRQKHMAEQAIDQAFAPDKAKVLVSHISGVP